MITATNSATATTTAAVTESAVTKNGAGSEDRFLKLLVAQLSNQDPLNPMDNAQMTSQMAQISTVSSIEKVNTTLGSLAAQLSSLQMLQGGSLVGRNVLVEGTQLALHQGQAGGAIDLATRADSVKVEILSAGGRVVDTIDLGRLEPGRHAFDWSAGANAGLVSASYRVTATSAGKPVAAAALVRDHIESVSSDNGVMNMQLRGLGSIPYSTVKAIL
ncbi:MAG: flagellar hook assembly protein FlgD [Rhodoferax sp.]|nr:flagellar hook assembly protein FlgD [Rhodoferax sp.]